jgi:serine/threonine-protein kinase RsbT
VERATASKVQEIEVVMVRGEADIYAAVGQGRMLADEIGFERSDQTRLETIVAELARNTLRHGGGGTITFRRLKRGGTDLCLVVDPGQALETREDAQPGLEVIAEDDGPGITDLARALADGFSTNGGLGAGLPAVRRLADEFTIESVPGCGTRVRVCKWGHNARWSSTHAHG